MYNTSGTHVHIIIKYMCTAFLKKARKMDIPGMISATSAIGSQIYGMFNANQQMNMSEELMQQQYNLNRLAAKDQEASSMRMFENTGYAARVDQLKRAGLNPGLIYGAGASGGGGVTGNIVAPQVGGQQAPNLAAYESNKLTVMGMGLQLAKLKSEIEVNESIAEQNRANVPKIGAEVPKIEAETLGQQTQNALLALDYEIKTAGKFASIDNIISLSQKAKVSVENEIQDLISKKTQNEVDTKTIQAKINQYNANVQKTIYDTLVANSTNELNKQKWRESVAEVAQKWIDKSISLEQIKAQLQQTAMNNGTKMDATELNGVLEIIKGLIQAGTFALLK